MLTIKQLYDMYPDSDLLAIEVTDTTVIADIEAMEASGRLGDTLFLFLCRKLCNTADDITPAGLAERCHSAITQLDAVIHCLQERERVVDSALHVRPRGEDQSSTP